MPTVSTFALKAFRVRMWIAEKKLLRFVPLWIIPERARQTRAKRQLKFINEFTEELSRLPLAFHPQVAASLAEAMRAVRQAQARV